MQTVLLILPLELEMSVVAVQRIHENSKKWCFLLNEKDFEAVLATFCCYDYGTNTSEAVQNIAIDQKDYPQCSSCVIVC